MAVDVLDIPLFDGSLQQAVEHILETCSSAQERTNRLVSATGAHGLVTTKKDAPFRSVLKAAYLNLPDGMPIVWVGRIKGSTAMERCYGPDVFAQVVMQTAHTSVRHFLCGGKEGVATRLKEVCAATFGNQNCAGVFCPPFRPMTPGEIQQLADEINSRNVDIVWIGLSTPKQEMFAFELAKRTNVHFIITVGAAFDFHIGAVRQAPRAMQQMGLEWLFRLLVEPRRLYKRYLEIVPLFIYYNIKEMMASHRR
jgi:N-acetylglucosaminyldiphosphoundecaprenol N-acetyl-beta-D-mannosaminyltransferase